MSGDYGSRRTILGFAVNDSYQPLPQSNIEYDETADLLSLPPPEEGDAVEEQQQELLPVVNTPGGTSSFKATRTRRDFGGKDITFLGGFCLLINNMTGPAVATVPCIFQESGWFTPSLMIILMTVLSSYATTFLCEAMANIPGNEEFEGRVELSTLAKAYFNKHGYVAVHIMLYIGLQSLNIGAIIISAQTMDYTLIAIFKWTCAVQVYPEPAFLVARDIPVGQDTAFTGIGITLGFVVVFLLTLPLGYFNLDDNIIVQKLSALLMISILLEWILQFCFQDLDWDRLPFITRNQSQVVGPIVFNYAFVTAIPSWVNEKKRGVGINKTTWSTNALSSVLFLLVGGLGALSFPIGPNQSLMALIPQRFNELKGPFRYITLVSAYVFPVSVLLPGIPVNSIVIRYNLVKSNLVKRKLAFFLSAVLPWIICLPFYSAGNFMNFINFVSLFVNGAINFIIPLWLYLLSYKLKAKYRVAPEQQLKTFKAMPMWTEKNSRKLARFWIFIAIVVSVGGIVFAFYNP